jgi:hypothetical protein
VFFTYQPTWDDCKQLLQTLFIVEEQNYIQQEARKHVQGPDRTPTGNQDVLWTVFPLVLPNWDPHSHAGNEALTNYHWLLLMGV